MSINTGGARKMKFTSRIESDVLDSAEKNLISFQLSLPTSAKSSRPNAYTVLILL